MKKKSQEQLYSSFLNNDLFLPWIISPSKDINEYWNIVMQKEPDKREVIDNLKIIIEGIIVEEEVFSNNAKKEVWNKIQTSIENKRNKQIDLYTVFRYVAVFLLAAGISIYLFLETSKPKEIIDYKSFLTEYSIQEGDPENVLIVLNNQERIEVKEKNVELIHDADGKLSVNMEIIKTEPDTEIPENNLNQLYVPYGKRSSLILSDGTKIWVNSGTRIIYPATFLSNKREIYVDGEIFLEVVKNEKSPFIVKTDILEINVLGTSFNVSAYKNDLDQSIVLTSGMVSVKEKSAKKGIKIKPNQKYTLNKEDQKCHLQEVNVFDHICWKYGFQVFRNERLSNVLKKIERYYNISLSYDSSLTDKTTLSGKLDMKENIEEIFRILSITAPIDYTIKENEIKIDVKH